MTALFSKALPIMVILILVVIIGRQFGMFRFFGPDKTVRGKVLSVYDGDTLKIRARARRRTIHLKGVDCPELNQPFGEEAREFTSKLVGQRVKFKLLRKDQRWAVVIHPDGWELNRELVKAGLAWAASKEYKDLEKVARKAKKGLWADKRSVPPWDWVGKAGPLMKHMAGCDQCWESMYEYEKRQIGLCVVGFRLMQEELKVGDKVGFPVFVPPVEWTAWWVEHKKTCSQCRDGEDSMCMEAFRRLQEELRKKG